ncbi:MAG: hypothetical protein HQL50_02050 [Magnetococcales bacterium]|nr:hypothetical protein [Magnetococcales bacterium]
MKRSISYGFLFVIIAMMMSGCLYTSSRSYNDFNDDGMTSDQAWEECNRESGRFTHYDNAHSNDISRAVAIKERQKQCMESRGFRIKK